MNVSFFYNFITNIEGDIFQDGSVPVIGGQIRIPPISTWIRLSARYIFNPECSLLIINEKNPRATNEFIS